MDFNSTSHQNHNNPKSNDHNLNNTQNAVSISSSNSRTNSPARSSTPSSPVRFNLPDRSTFPSNNGSTTSSSPIFNNYNNNNNSNNSRIRSISQEINTKNPNNSLNISPNHSNIPLVESYLDRYKLSHDHNHNDSDNDNDSLPYNDDDDENNNNTQKQWNNILNQNLHSSLNNHVYESVNLNNRDVSIDSNDVYNIAAKPTNLYDPNHKILTGFVLNVYQLMNRKLNQLGLTEINITVFALCFRCICWYISSSLCSNTSKQILNYHKYPMTLTLVQFIFVAVLTRIALHFPTYASLNKGGALSLLGTILPGTCTGIDLRNWSKNVVLAVTPLGIFQAVSHIFTSEALSRVPVSTVHTIKALSPLFTVFFYRFFFDQGYTSKIYISLVPLTLGVMMVCIGGSEFDLIGSFFALMATIVFVLQNIFSKKLFIAQEEKLLGPKMDKMNLLYYSSIFSFICMSPFWILSDVKDWTFPNKNSSDHSGIDHELHGHLYIFVLYFLNGIFQYLQSVNAFSVLELTSPVTYSIASLIKRVFVIATAIIWFHQLISLRQGFGIILTFIGLYIYSGAKNQSSHNKDNNKDKPKLKSQVLPH